MMLQPYAPNQLNFLYRVHCQLRPEMKQYGDLDPLYLVALRARLAEDGDDVGWPLQKSGYRVALLSFVAYNVKCRGIINAWLAALEIVEFVQPNTTLDPLVEQVVKLAEQ